MKNGFAEFSIEPLASCRKSCQRTANFINERRHNPYRVNPTSYNKPISAVVVDLHTSVSRLRVALENAIPSGFLRLQWSIKPRISIVEGDFETRVYYQRQWERKWMAIRTYLISNAYGR